MDDNIRQLTSLINACESAERYIDMMHYTDLLIAQKNEKKYIGLVAQDVKKIYPELVSYTEEEDVYQLDYSATGIIAIKAVQELKKEVELLSKENKILKRNYPNTNN